MHCKEIRKKLSPYQDGQLSPAESDIIREHLKICSDCAAEFEELNLVWNALLQVETVEKAPFFWQKLSGKLTSEKSKSRKRQSVFELRLSPMPVIALILILFSLWTGFFLGKNISLYANNAAPGTLDLEQENMVVINSVDVIAGETGTDIYQEFLSTENQSDIR